MPSSSDTSATSGGDIKKLFAQAQSSLSTKRRTGAGLDVAIAEDVLALDEHPSKSPRGADRGQIGRGAAAYQCRMRSSQILAALFLAACAAHEPAARLHVPDDAPPAVESDARTLPEAPPQVEEEAVVAAESEPERPVKVIDSPESDAYERGKREAQADIDQGRLGLETFGYPARCRYQYASILINKYKVHLRVVAGCVVDRSISEHARGYNEIMRAEIMRRHGSDVFERASAEAGC